MIKLVHRQSVQMPTTSETTNSRGSASSFPGRATRPRSASRSTAETRAATRKVAGDRARGRQAARPRRDRVRPHPPHRGAASSPTEPTWWGRRSRPLCQLLARWCAQARPNDATSPSGRRLFDDLGYGDVASASDLGYGDVASASEGKASRLTSFSLSRGACGSTSPPSRLAWSRGRCIPIPSAAADAYDPLCVDAREILRRPTSLTLMQRFCRPPRVEHNQDARWADDFHGPPSRHATLGRF